MRAKQQKTDKKIKKRRRVLRGSRFELKRKERRTKLGFEREREDRIGR